MANKWISDSYAKINLGLNLIGQSESNILDIEAGFYFIEWADRIEITHSNRHNLVVDGPFDIPNTDNLMVRAIELLEKETGLKDKFNIYLKKNVPIKAGFGIAASNAATLMLMANKIANLGLSKSDLMELGGRLRFDVPTFINGENGILNTATGEFESLEALEDFYIIAGYPDIQINRDDFLQYIYNIEPLGYPLKNLLLDDPEEWPFFLENALEPTLFQIYELIGNMRDQFYEFGATYASMNGSGSSVYGLFNQEFVAIHAFDSFHSLGFKSNITRPNFKPDQGIYIIE